MARSVRRERRDLARMLRGQGRTWVEIADEIRARWPELTPRAAVRIAHRWTQANVVTAWSGRFSGRTPEAKEISRWEVWPSPSGVRPSLSALDKLAQIYECSISDLLVDVSDYRSRDVARRTAFLPADPPASWPATATTQRGGQDDDVDRRAFTVGATLSALGISTHGLLDTTTRAPSVSMDHVDAIEASIANLERRDADIGGGSLSQLAVDLHAQVTGWLDHASYASDVGSALHAVRLDLGAWAGWLTYDAGQTDRARHLLHDTILSARLRDDPMAEVRALAVMSMVLHRGRRPKEALECALAAQRIARGWATPRLAGLLHLRSARAHATLNERRAFTSEIAKAQTQLDHGPHDDDPLYVQFVTPHLLTGTIGLSHLAMGKPDRAVTAFREATEDPSWKRNVAYRTVHLAIATAQQGDLNEASTIGLAAIPLVTGVESDRTSTSLHALRASLAGHRHAVPSVAEFTDAYDETFAR